MSVKTEIIPVLDMARKVPKLREETGKDTATLREFFYNYVSIANFLQFMGIKLKTTRKGEKLNPDNWGASEWSSVYREIAAERHAAEGDMFKKSANDVSVYNLNFLHDNFEEAKLKLLQKKHPDMYS